MNVALLRLGAARSLTLFTVVMFSVLNASFVSAEGLDAVLHWQRTVPLSTPVSGVVVKVNTQVGSRVEKGQALLQLDDRARRARVDALQAELKHAENNRDESRREMERTQELYDRTLISDHDLEMARIQRDDSQAQYQTARANLVQAQMDLEYSTVRAPFAGWVVQRNVEVGQTIATELQAEPLVVVVGADLMFARTQMPGAELSKLKIGHKANVIMGEIKYRGKISYIGLTPVTGTVDRYDVDVVFSTGGKFYRAGQTAKVSVWK